MATLIGNWSPLSGLNTAILQGLDFQVVVNKDVPIFTQQTLSSPGIFFLDPNPQHTSYRDMTGYKVQCKPYCQDLSTQDQ